MLKKGLGKKTFITIIVGAIILLLFSQCITPLLLPVPFVPNWMPLMALLGNFAALSVIISILIPRGQRAKGILLSLLFVVTAFILQWFIWTIIDPISRTMNFACLSIDLLRN